MYYLSLATLLMFVTSVSVHMSVINFGCFHVNLQSSKKSSLSLRAPFGDTLWASFSCIARPYIAKNILKLPLHHNMVAVEMADKLPLWNADTCSCKSVKVGHLRYLPCDVWGVIPAKINFGMLLWGFPMLLLSFPMLSWCFPILFCTFNYVLQFQILLFIFDFLFASDFIIRFRIMLFRFEFYYLLSNSVLLRIMFSVLTIISVLYLRIVLFLNVLCGPRFCFSCFELCSSKSGSSWSSAALVSSE